MLVLAFFICLVSCGQGQILTSYLGQAITCPSGWWLVADQLDATTFYYCSGSLQYKQSCALGTCVDPNFYFGKLEEIGSPCGFFCDGTGLRPGANDGSSASYSCHFLNDDCSVDVLGPTDPYADFVWVRKTGPSPSYANVYVADADKGPPYGHTTKDNTDGYMFLEGNRGEALSSNSLLILPDSRSGVEPMRMNFNYFMHGATFDGGSSLSVLVQYEENGSTVSRALWRQTGDKGDAWQDATVALPGGIDGGFKVIFRAFLGTNTNGFFLHDFGLDDIEILSGAVLANDCKDLKDQGNVVDGYYLLTTDHGEQRTVYCSMDTGGTVILRHSRDGIDFNRDWAEYKAGFGGAPGAAGDLWYGLENLAQDTYVNAGTNTYTLRIDLTAHDGTVYDAQYANFKVATEPFGYQLISTGYLGGTAGDALLSIADTSATNMRFSTIDDDNDKDVKGHCADRHMGGWWFNSCSDSCLTSPMTPAGQPTAETCTSGLCTGWRTLGDMTFKSVMMTLVRN